MNIDTPQYAIEANNLVKYYGGTKALDNVSLTVKNGDICGLIGPNGAGKTTLIRILLGLVKPDSGSYRLFGVNPSEARVRVYSRVGYLPEYPSLPTFYTGEKLLDFTGRIYSLDKAERRKRIKLLLELVGLHEARDKKIKEYSKGMIKRLSLAQALISSPDLLILDEPTEGLDPEGIIWFRDCIRSLSDHGTTVLMCSHILSEVERISTNVAIIHRGRIIFSGLIEEAQKFFLGEHLRKIDLEKIYLKALKESDVR